MSASSPHSTFLTAHAFDAIRRTFERLSNPHLWHPTPIYGYPTPIYGRYWIDPKRKSWAHWDEKLSAPFRIAPDTPFYRILVRKHPRVRMRNLVLSSGRCRACCVG